jgi:hypothetical protein
MKLEVLKKPKASCIVSCADELSVGRGCVFVFFDAVCGKCRALGCDELVFFLPLFVTLVILVETLET